MAVIFFLVAIAIAIFGYPLLWYFSTETTSAIQLNLAYAMLVLTMLSLIIGFAADIHKREF